MKRVVFAAVLLACSSTMASAQVRFGAGVVYTDLDPMGLGLQVNAYAPVPTILPGLRIGGDFTFYLPQSERETFMGETVEVDVNLLELNGNGQYEFVAQNNMAIYGLAGLNFSRMSAKISFPGFDSESDSETKMGLNLGGGAQFGTGFGAIYGEAKYVLAGDDWGRFVLGAGVRF